jgi:ubiquinone/menaquinone biosynthesis C-methylase UbiE
MSIAESLLYHLSKRWPAPKRPLKADGTLIGEAYHLDYALKMQYQACVRNGIIADIQGKEILEIGCGHGGITCFLALNGAKRVVGIDLNTYNLSIAEKFREQLTRRVFGDVPAKLKVEFLEKNATAMDYPEHSFDMVWAENVFEHFMEPEAVMQEAFRVLRPGGQLVVPVFSSIYSKYGAHLKQGLKLPWSNLFFSEKAICNVLFRLAQDNPGLFDMYPGLADKPHKIRDLRRYKDLNDITFGKFKRMAVASGFQIVSFNSKTPSGLIRLCNKVIRRTPMLRNTLLYDIFSTGAEAVLKKQE